MTAPSAGTTVGRVVRGSDGPFDVRGVVRDARDVPRYRGLSPSVTVALADVVARTPESEAVYEPGGARLSYAELWERGRRIAGGLQAAGVRPGDRVGLHLPNGVPWVEAFVGVLIAGGVLVPINTRLTREEVRHVLEDAGCRVVIDADTPAPLADPVAPFASGPAELTAIFYTSGTTGRSKGATSTHEALLAVAENLRRSSKMPADLGSELRTLICVPLFHVTGFAAQLLPVLLAGGAAVLQDGVDVGAIGRHLAEERISYLVAVPAIYYYLLGHRGFEDVEVPQLRWAFYGGAPIAPELVARIKRRFPAARVANGFGMSETSSLATLLPHEESDSHAASIGRPCPAVDVGLLDADTTTGVGEILLRGQSVTTGYWGDGRRHADAFVDGWLRTGDLGRLDEDGRLYLVDRVKDMINRGGENVFSVEVENALADAPGVREVAVVGVPDAMMGEKVGCVLVPADGEVDVEAILRHAATRIADYKVPQYLTIRNEPLPRNPGGKVLKQRLREETTWGHPLR